MKTNRFFFLRRQSFGNGYITVRRAPSLQALGLSFLHPHLGSSGPPVSRACWLMTNGVGHFPKEITTKPCRPARCPFVGSVSFSFFHFYSCPIGFDFHLYHCSSVDILFFVFSRIFTHLFLFLFSLSLYLSLREMTPLCGLPWFLVASCLVPRLVAIAQTTKMTTIWNLSTPTRNGRLCLSSRHCHSGRRLSNVSCQSTERGSQ